MKSFILEMDHLSEIPRRTFPAHPFLSQTVFYQGCYLLFQQAEWQGKCFFACSQLTCDSSRGEHKTMFCNSPNVTLRENEYLLVNLSSFGTEPCSQQELHCAPRRLFLLIHDIFLPHLPRGEALISVTILSPFRFLRDGSKQIQSSRLGEHTAVVSSPPNCFKRHVGP